MLKLKKASLIAFSLLMGILPLENVVAQNAASNEIVLTVTADKPDWVYKIGEIPKFKITATQNGKAVKELKVKYELGPEKLTATKVDSVSLTKGEAIVNGYSLKEPGFLRITVSKTVKGKQLRSLATAAFDPLSIKPTITVPDGFNKFWDKAKSDLAKIPVNAKLELLADKSTDKVNVYHVSIDNIGNSKIYGILCTPKKEGKYPALLQVPGAGVRGYAGFVDLAEKGIITFQIGIHGIPVNLPAEVYKDLASGALFRYNTFNLDNKDDFYYKRVYLGCVRALDFINTLPSYDGTNLAVQGGSQGGALAIVTSALDKRVKCLVSVYPALADVTGYLYNRAGGWPHYLAGNNANRHNIPNKLETMQYYDVVNFAKQLTIPGFYTWGFNDVTCPPTSMYAAYNVITAPKELVIYKETGHNTVSAQVSQYKNWLISQLKK